MIVKLSTLIPQHPRSLSTHALPAMEEQGFVQTVATKSEWMSERQFYFKLREANYPDDTIKQIWGQKLEQNQTRFVNGVVQVLIVTELRREVRH